MDSRTVLRRWMVVALIVALAAVVAFASVAMMPLDARPAGAADPPPPTAEPTGEGHACEDAPTDEPYDDVTQEDPSYDEIVCLVAAELAQGTSESTYEPNRAATRRQMALFIKRLADLMRANSGTCPESTSKLRALPVYDGDPDYSDVGDESEAFAQAIGQVSQAEIVGGFSDGTYRPGVEISRRQMAAFVNRLHEYLTGAAFPDNGNYYDDDDGDSGEEDLDAVTGAGIFQGDGQGNVDPGGDLSRRQMANILLRYYEVVFADGDTCRLFPGGNGSGGNGSGDNARANV